MADGQSYLAYIDGSGAATISRYVKKWDETGSLVSYGMGRDICGVEVPPDSQFDCVKWFNQDFERYDGGKIKRLHGAQRQPRILSPGAAGVR